MCFLKGDARSKRWQKLDYPSVRTRVSLGIYISPNAAARAAERKKKQLRLLQNATRGLRFVREEECIAPLTGSRPPKLAVQFGCKLDFATDSSRTQTYAGFT